MKQRRQDRIMRRMAARLAHPAVIGGADRHRVRPVYGGALLLAFSLLLAAGCATLSPPADRYTATERVARTGGLQKSYIKTTSFTLTAYTRTAGPGDPLTIYIEGDGAAWRSRTRLADDPTPQNPLVLELAALDPAANVAYLARPGQYPAAGLPGCDASYWSERRFADEVVEAMNGAVETLRTRARATQIHLVGYSGGAAIAVLIADRRSDVASLRTVAGNLDPDAVNRYHHVSPLKGSLDPMAVAEKLARLPQRHFIGSEDTVVPSRIAQSFVKRAGRKDFRQITVVDGATHTRGWRERWPMLLADPPLPGE